MVLAGGRGERLRREINKVYLPVGKSEILEYSLDTFRRSPEVSGLVVVTRHEDRDHVAGLLADIDEVDVRLVTGGPSRHRSEHLGIEALAEEIEGGTVEWVGVHDGARPFISLDLFHVIVEEARARGGAIPALGVAGPMYHRTEGRAELLDTHAVRRAQTPQVFRAADLWRGYQAAETAGFEGVDTAETVERFTDLEVGIVEGDPRNIKVTFVEDLLEAEDLAAAFEEGQWSRSGPEW